MPVASKTLNVNGEVVDAYVVGDGKEQTITLKGMVPDLINAFDVGFFASVWNNSKSAMTVSKINAWIHEDDNNEPIQIASYGPLDAAIREELKGEEDKVTFSWNLGFLGKGSKDETDAVVKIVKEYLSGGFERTGMFGLTKFIQPSTITFRNLVENGAQNLNNGILILDEEPIHKKIDAFTVDNQLFANRFPGATFTGLKNMVNNISSDEATQTANVLYTTIKTQFSKDAAGNPRVVSVNYGIDLKIISFVVDATVRFEGLLDGLFTSGEEMAALLRKLEVEVSLSTIPYSDNVDDYGTKGNPLTPEAPYYPIIIWGLATDQDFSLEN